jgi:hypothetical protein
MAHLTYQSHTAYRLGLCAQHAAVVGADDLRQSGGNGATRRIVRLGPVERHPKDSAARATLLTIEISIHECGEKQSDISRNARLGAKKAAEF